MFLKAKCFCLTCVDFNSQWVLADFQTSVSSGIQIFTLVRVYTTVVVIGSQIISFLFSRGEVICSLINTWKWLSKDRFLSTSGNKQSISFVWGRPISTILIILKRKQSQCQQNRKEPSIPYTTIYHSSTLNNRNFSGTLKSRILWLLLKILLAKMACVLIVSWSLVAFISSFTFRYGNYFMLLWLFWFLFLGWFQHLIPRIPHCQCHLPNINGNKKVSTVQENTIYIDPYNKVLC